MNPSSAMLMGVVSAFGTLASLVVEITLLVVVLTAVRRHRPDASGLLAGSAATSFVATLASSVFYLVAPVFLRSGGMEAWMPVQAAFSAFMTIIHVLAGVLLIVGLARLAAPPRAGRDPGRYE